MAPARANIGPSTIYNATGTDMRIPDSPRRPLVRLPRWLAALEAATILMMLAFAAPASAQEAILRVGVVNGSPPCSYLDKTAWRGIAIDLWRVIAARERLPYKVYEWPSIAAMLEATREGALDVAVECINVSPERLGRYRFSLPFQEDGQAVMTGTSPFNYGHAFLESLFSLTLLKLLGAFALVISAVCALIWKIEGYATTPGTVEIGRARTIAKLFLSIFTGAGSEKVVATVRGNAILALSYIIRGVFASLLVGYVTVSVVRESNEHLKGHVQRLDDLIGRRVAVRAGTISESLLKELNGNQGAQQAEIVPLADLGAAFELLEKRKVDAILADELQIRYLSTHNSSKTLVTGISIRRIRPESQAFAFSADLAPEIVARINNGISSFKRSGVVSSLVETTLGPPSLGGR